MAALTNEEKFEIAAKKAEQKARNSPFFYRFNLLLFSLLGYSVIFGSILLLIAILGGMLFLSLKSGTFAVFIIKNKLILFIIPVLWVLLRSLYVRFDQPSGYELTRKRFPFLFAELDNLRKKLKTSAIHRVILKPEMNAGIIQTPQLGLFLCSCEDQRIRGG